MSSVASPAALRFEHRTEDEHVLGIGTPAPRLSWFVPDAPPGFVQQAYEVEMSRAGGDPEVARVAGPEPDDRLERIERDGVDVRRV